MTAGMTAAAVIAAGVLFSMLMIMMIARRMLSKSQRARQQRCNRIIAAALNARIELDAKAAQRILRAAADAAADQRIRAVHHQHARQSAMAAAGGVDHLGGNNLSVLNLIELELLAVSKVLENLSILIGYCNLHFDDLLL